MSAVPVVVSLGIPYCCYDRSPPRHPLPRLCRSDGINIYWKELTPDPGDFNLYYRPNFVHSTVSMSLPCGFGAHADRAVLAGRPQLHLAMLLGRMQMNTVIVEQR